MSPVTHGLLSWLAARGLPLERRDRVLVTAAGVAPDLDGIGLLIGFLIGGPAMAHDLFSAWHHRYGHLLLGALIATALVAWLARRRPLAALAAFAVFHLHLLCDLVGGRGPDGHQWPMPYLWPVADWNWAWSGQWALNAWPNFAITGAALLTIAYLAWRAGASPLECLSRRLDDGFVTALRQRFGMPGDGPASASELPSLPQDEPL